MAELTNYTGNAGLGLGSNPNTPAIDPKANLNQINQTARDVMLLDNQNNMNIFNKKVNDRDKLNELILSNQVSTGNILPEYQPIYDRAKDEVQKEYLKWGGNFNDTNGYRKYQEKVEQLKDVAAHAQVRTTELQKLKQQRSGERLPATQKAMDEWYGKQAKKSFWEQVDPYQQMYSFNMDHILNNAQPVKTTVRDPNNPLMSNDVTYFDYQDTLRKTKNGWLNDADIANSINTFVDKFQQYDEPQKRKTIDSMNNQLDRYNQEVGLLKQGRPFAEGDEGYVTPFQTVTTPQGQTILKEPVQELAAKYALANQENFVTKTPKFNKDLANFGLQKAKIGVDMAYKNAMASSASKKANAYVDNIKSLIKSRSGQADQDAALDELYLRNFEQQPSLIFGRGNNEISLSRFKADNSLPMFTLKGKTPEILIPIGGKPIYSNYDDADKKKPSKGAKILYYEGGYYEPTYTLNGKNLQVSQIADIYKKFKKTAGSEWGIGIEDFIKEAVKNKKFKLLIKGANGTTDEDLSRAAQRIISNVNTKKGQEGVFEPPVDEQVPEDNQPQPQEQQ